MTDKQRAKLAMFKASLLVLQSHAAAYAANKALQAAVAKFAGLVAGLNPENQASQPASGGLTAVKQKTRDTLATRGGDVAAALYALATDPDHEDPALKAAADYTVRGLGRKPDADLIRIGRILFDRATEHAPALAGHDVSAADLQALRDALTKFAEEQATPRAALAEGAAGTKTLARDYREAQALLQDQIDRQLTRYETKDAAFFAAYQSARKPNSTARRAAKSAAPKAG